MVATSARYSSDFRQSQEEQQQPSTSTSTSSLSALRRPNLPCVCAVCGDGASEHLHYGAICCFSCRAFFRRYADREGSAHRSNADTCTQHSTVYIVQDTCTYHSNLYAGSQLVWYYSCTWSFCLEQNGRDFYNLVPELPYLLYCTCTSRSTNLLWRKVLFLRSYVSLPRVELTIGNYMYTVQ